jgi:hypothetical protein
MPVPRLATALVVAAILVAASVIWQGSSGFNLEDEGFLWYGAQRALRGEVPIRDFMSYDPGRYYWSAALMLLFHDDGIMILRYGAAAFQGIGLFVALFLLLRRQPRVDVTWFILAATTLLLWMYPRHKLFDISLSILLVGLLTILVERPSRMHFFLVGIGVGLTAVFGRNHGLYGLVGILGISIYLACAGTTVRDLMLGLLCCAVGVSVGFLPVLLMIAFVPGFAEAFWESIRLILERSETNLPLPVPWPWLVPIKELARTEAASRVIMGAIFLALPAFAAFTIVWVVRRARQQKTLAPEIVACAAMMVPYAQYVYSRADIGHLAQGIFPFLIGALLLLGYAPQMTRWLASLAIAGASTLIMLPIHPGWQCRAKSQCVALDVAGDLLQAPPEAARAVGMLQTVTARYVPEGRSFLVAPLWPGAYALLKRRSPMWDIYALLPRSEPFQRREIERIKAANPSLVLILDVPNDGRDDLRFRNTHPLIERFIRENFNSVTVADWPQETYRFYKSQ